MVTVLKLPAENPKRFGYKRAKKSRKNILEDEGQLNLFTEKEPKILTLPSHLSPFEEALMLDENCSPAAKNAYRKSIEEGDFIADSYCNLGILESETNNIIAAFDCFTNSLKHDPRHLEAHFNLANLYFEQSDLKLAQIHYEIAAAIEPDFANVYFNLGLVFALNGRFDSAISNLYKYKDLVPTEDRKKADSILRDIRKNLKAK